MEDVGLGVGGMGGVRARADVQVTVVEEHNGDGRVPPERQCTK